MDSKGTYGRTAFSKYRSLIEAFCNVVRYTPDIFRDMLWRFSICGDSKFDCLIRYSVLRARCKSLGSNVYIGPNVIIKNPKELSIGNNVSIHFGSYIDAIGGCVIGNDVSIAHMSSIITFEHTWNDISQPIKYNPIITGNIAIGDDVWIGCGVRVLSGSVIGSRVVIAAGAVVKGECSDDMLYAGAPVRAIKALAS